MEGNTNGTITALDRWKSPENPGNGFINRSYRLADFCDIISMFYRSAGYDRCIILTQLLHFIPVLGPSCVVSGYKPTSVDNPDLTWEKTSMINVGLDLRAFNGYLTFTGEFSSQLEEARLRKKSSWVNRHAADADGK